MSDEPPPPPGVVTSAAATCACGFGFGVGDTRSTARLPALTGAAGCGAALGVKDAAPFRAEVDNKAVCVKAPAFDTDDEDDDAGVAPTARPGSTGFENPPVRIAVSGAMMAADLGALLPAFSTFPLPPPLRFTVPFGANLAAVARLADRAEACGNCGAAITG